MAPTEPLLQLGDWIARLLPVVELPQTLAELALGWQRISKADTAVVFIPADRSRCFIGSAVAGDETGQASLWTPDSVARNPAESPNDVESIAAAVLAHLKVAPSPDQSLRIVPCQSDAAIAAGAVLLFPSGAVAEQSRLDLLAEVSRGVLQQALWLAREPDRLRNAKLEALAELAAGAGHEINNPLATIAGRAALLLRSETDPERRRDLATIGGQAHRIRDMIGDLMLFGRPPQPQPVRLDLAQSIENVIAAFAEQAAERRCPLITELAPGVAVWADTAQLSVVISSLLQNALDASADGDKITLRSWPTQSDGVTAAAFSVHNPSCRMTETDREHLFDPFYSGRQAGRGLGFGLSKAWRIVQQHGGRIEFEGGHEQGTTFTVVWPAGPAS